MAEKNILDRNLALEAVRVTEAAALSASRLMGRGDEKAADQAAVDAMRRALNSLAIDGEVVIGEGERDEAPMLYIGEKVGLGTGPRVDIALDPLEGTTLTAKGGPNALAVIAMAESGGFLNAPDVYMDKLAVGGGLPANIVDIDASPAQNLAELAKATRRDVSDLVVCILDRPRHSGVVKDECAFSHDLKLVVLARLCAQQYHGFHVKRLRKHIYALNTDHIVGL